MERIDSLRDCSLLESELLGVHAVALFVLVNGRNAWWNTTSRRYPGANALTASLSDAKASAEPRRKQGTWFTIAEVPGLILLGGDGAVGAVDFHPSRPFVGWNGDADEVLRIGASLGMTIQALTEDGVWRGRRPDADSFIQGRLSGQPATARRAFESLRSVGPRSVFKHWTSMSHGGGYLLGWNSSKGRDYSAAGVSAIRNRFVRVNGRDEVEMAFDRYWADQRRDPKLIRIRRYVEAVFGARTELDRDIHAQGATEQIEAILETISPREAAVVTMRLGLSEREPQSVAVVARRLGLTPERVRQTQSKAVSKLRHPSRSQVMREYLSE